MDNFVRSSVAHYVPHLIDLQKMKSKLLTASFVGNYLIASSVVIAFANNGIETNGDDSDSIGILLVSVLLGLAIKRKKNFARVIVAFSSTLLSALLCMIFIFGFIYGTEHINYGFGSILQVSDPTLLQHIILGPCFAVWFGLPAFLLATKPVRAEFENESSRSRRSWTTHFTRQKFDNPH